MSANVDTSASKISAAQFKIATVGMRVGYANNLLLKDVRLNLIPGKTIALSGEIGAGKSTLLKVLGLLAPPLAGKVYFSELDCDNLNRSELDILIQHYIAYIFQTPELMMNWTAAENVNLALMAKGYTGFAATRKLVKYSELLDIKRILSSKTPVYRLSGGEKQLVGIARALAQHPALTQGENAEPFFIIADEPTSSLDRAKKIEVVERLVDIAKNQQIALVMTTHDTFLLDKFDKKFYIDKKSKTLIDT